MERRIQYAKTKDGVSIALCTMGDGMPLVWMPNIPLSHATLQWQGPRHPQFVPGLSAEPDASAPAHDGAIDQMSSR